MYEEFLEKASNFIDEGNGKDAFLTLQLLDKITDQNFWQMNNSRIAELFGAAFSIIGDAEGATEAYLDAACNDRFLRAQRGHISSYLFLLHYLQDVKIDFLYRELATFETLFDDTPQLSPKSYKHRKIRIGYLMPNAKESSLSNFVIPLFTKFDKDKFEVYVYTFQDANDAFAKEVKKSVSCFKIVNNIYTFDTAKIINNDEIDILVDLTAHGLGGDTLSILAYRPAKIQIAGIGFPSVTNLSFIDYIIADDILIDKKMQDAPLNLPNALVFRPNKDMLIPYDKHKKKGIIIGVFNNFLKITDEMLLLWKEILASASGVELLLQDSSIYKDRISFMRERVKSLKIKDKITIKLGSKNYLQDMANVDLILDTYPYTGGFMTATAITLGVPVITLAGKRFSSRFSASILNAANLNNYVAKTKKSYKTKALEIIEKIANNSQENIRERIKNSKLFDEESYMKNLEEAYINIVK